MSPLPSWRGELVHGLAGRGDVRWAVADLREPVHSNLPRGFLEPSAVEAGAAETAERIEPPTIPLDARKDCFAEVEMAYDEATARCEAHRCLRCDLRFTRMKDDVSSAACAGAERERV